MIMTDSLLIIAAFAFLLAIFLLSIQKLFKEQERKFAEFLAKQRQEIIEIIEEINSDDKNS